ncbi:MAG: glucose 1-dehydrogenase [Deltaproteobacteria bacterium]|nr:glucose 1-dehydrogenase [Deltaproteobacteria bacterium]
MKAIAVTPGSPGTFLVERDRPQIQAPDDIEVKVLDVGICGTDREEAAGGRCKTPEGRQDIVIGHEMLGSVQETGKAVTQVRPGDYIVFTVRRGCGHCAACAMGRPDMCTTGDYTERGIWGHDGYQSELVVDGEQYCVKVPQELRGIGVLVEPLSVAEKAIDEGVMVQRGRLPYVRDTAGVLSNRNILVAGLGPIGLLAAFILRLRGARVYGLDVVDRGSPRASLLEQIGGTYIDGRKVMVDDITKVHGTMDMVFEATGVASLEFDLLDTLGQNGLYVLTGIPGGDRPVQVRGAEIIRQLVLDNRVMIGSVNASKAHYTMAVDDLLRSRQVYGTAIDKVITQRVPSRDFGDAFLRHTAEEIKTIIQWG